MRAAERNSTRFQALPVVVGARRWYHSISRMWFPISVHYWSNTLRADCTVSEIIFAFSTSHTSLSKEFWITGSYYDSGLLRQKNTYALPHPISPKSHFRTSARRRCVQSPNTLCTQSAINRWRSSINCWQHLATSTVVKCCQYRPKTVTVLLKADRTTAQSGRRLRAMMHALRLPVTSST